jgi:hypothetical protein
MRKPRIFALILTAVVFALFVVAAPQASGQDMPSLSFEGWKRSGEPEIYKRDGLYGYIDGGAEIFLQYGFRELSVTRYAATAGPGKSASKTVTLEIFRMESPADAFGIFSVKRTGNEYVSPTILAPRWTSGGQANLMKGDYFINIRPRNPRSLTGDSGDSGRGRKRYRPATGPPEPGWSSFACPGIRTT